MTPKDCLRRLLRHILKHLSRAVLNKHQPQVIALIGNHGTAVLREIIYTMLHEHLPTRRNLEAPEAEFVVPLTIFGTDFYPRNGGGWLKVLAKTSLQLFTVKKHANILILEMTTRSGEILDYWLEITRPKMVIACGAHPESRLVDTSNTITLPALQNPISGIETLPQTYRETALKIGTAFGIDEAAVESALGKFTLPPPRLKLLNRRGGGLLLDATYEYRPPERQAIEEILAGLPGKAIWIQSPNDRRQPPTKPQDTVVVFGPRKDLLEVIEELSPNPLLDS